MVDDLQPGGATITTRTKNQIRPVWDARVADSEEVFSNISLTLGEPLTIPAACTGITIGIQNPAELNALYIYPLSGVVGAATADQAGSILTDASKNFTTAGVSVGDRVRNLSDGSIGVVSVVGTTTVTHSLLAGGTNDDWEIGDNYRIETIAGPRIVIDGGLADHKYRYFALAPDWNDEFERKTFYLLAEVATQDAWATYHFD